MEKHREKCLILIMIKIKFCIESNSRFIYFRNFFEFVKFEKCQGPPLVIQISINGHLIKMHVIRWRILFLI